MTRVLLCDHREIHIKLISDHQCPKTIVITLKETKADCSIREIRNSVIPCLRGKKHCILMSVLYFIYFI